jgi:hypothetical protein
MVVCPLTKKVLIPDRPPKEKVWIPPAGLLAGHAAHGLSWIVLAVLAVRHGLAFSFPGLAWIHLVALGWLTMTALTILVHVVPGFLGVTWKGGHAIRWLLAPVGIGIAGLVTAFWWESPPALAVAATVLVAGLTGYLAVAGATLIAFVRSSPATARVGNGFMLVLTLLAATAVLGVGMAWTLAGVAPWPTLLRLAPPIHAHLGAVGWLSMLIFGVLARTVRPITGGPSPWPKLHVVVTSATTVGLLTLVTGLTGEWPTVSAIGAGIMILASGLFGIDLAATLRQARNPHRTPHAFLTMAALYFTVAGLIGAGILAGRPWQTAYAYLGLLGWLGQMVLAHLHHIGIRVLATVARGDMDDTRPQEILTPALSWGSFGLFQLAIAGGTVCLIQGNDHGVALAALAGFAGWATMSLNVVQAWRNAKRLPPDGPQTVG